MQTFLPYQLYSESAKCLDQKRLGKQRVECLQILRTLQLGHQICDQCRDTFEYGCCEGYGKPVTTPWYHHPAVQMWKGFEKQLAIYGLYICYEWKINRNYQDTCFDKIYEILKNKYDQNYIFEYNNDINCGSVSSIPFWLGNNEFHASHRSNLLRKNPNYYKQFGWAESNNLAYVWPKN